MILKGTSKNPAFMASSLTDRVIRAGLSADRQALSLFPGLCPTGRNVAQYSRANQRGQKVGVMQVRSVPVCGGPGKRERPDLYFWSSTKFYETEENEFEILCHYLEYLG